MFQLPVTSPGKAECSLGQFVDSQRVDAVLHDVAVHTFPVLAEIIAGIQRFPWVCSSTGSARRCRYRLCPSTPSTRNLISSAALRISSAEQIMRVKNSSSSRMKGQLCLRMDGFPFQHCHCMLRSSVFQARQQQASSSQSSNIIQSYRTAACFPRPYRPARLERCHLFHQIALVVVRLTKASAFDSVPRLSVQPYGYQLRVQRSCFGGSLCWKFCASSGIRPPWLHPAARRLCAPACRKCSRL